MELQKNLGIKEFNISLRFFREEQKSHHYPNDHLHRVELTLI